MLIASVVFLCIHFKLGFMPLIFVKTCGLSMDKKSPPPVSEPYSTIQQAPTLHTYCPLLSNKCHSIFYCTPCLHLLLYSRWQTIPPSSHGVKSLLLYASPARSDQYTGFLFVKTMEVARTQANLWESRNTCLKHDFTHSRKSSQPCLRSLA